MRGTSSARRRASKHGFLSALLGASVVVTSTVVALPGSFVIAAHAASSGQPNLFDPNSAATSVNHLPPEPAPEANPTPGTPTPFMKNPTVSMAPASFSLSVSTPSHFVSSDGRLLIDVPAGALSPTDLAADGGSTSLLVRQILPQSGSNAGGSGHYSFGTYLIQILNSSGQLANHGLQQPVTLTMHYGASSALDIAHAYMVLNVPIPSAVNLDPSSVVVGPTPQQPSRPASRPVVPSSPNPSPRPRSSINASTPSPSPSSGPSQTSQPARWLKPLRDSLGPRTPRRSTFDPSAGTLSGGAPLSSPSTSVTWGTDSPVATFGKPSPFEIDLGGGSLTAEYNIDVPAGPKGFKPPLSLIYNSAGVTGQHNPQGAAGWVGEGWNMTLGEISWAEHNTAGTGTPTWQNSWELSDAYGTSAELIPPNVFVSTYNDDTGRPITASPIRWHTASETYAKVYSFISPITSWPPSYGAIPPCFRVFLRSGIMEEFGCTLDSLQYYLLASRPNTPYVANWLLDMITEPDGNQIHVSYVQDQPSGSIRDAVMTTTCGRRRCGSALLPRTPSMPPIHPESTAAPAAARSAATTHSISQAAGGSPPQSFKATSSSKTSTSRSGMAALPIGIPCVITS
ncbi:MAG: hypothetical protein E6I69_13535 [Chloroflexi bacterium]|nr:MAG: hypothetical protein E6I69_13535 [Chloroflexota bacterium]